MKLAAIFSEHLMLQRDKETYIFGETDISEDITVTIDDISVTEKVSSGEFRIKLPAHKAGGPYTLTVSGESGTVSVEDVLYGEVWLANGQSNIELELQGARGGLDIIDSTDNDMIRFYNVPKAAIMDEVPDMEKGLTWRLVKKGDFKDISAIGYYFADVVSRELGVPVGIVDCYRGGSSVTCWLSEDVLKPMPEGKAYFDTYNAASEGRTEEEYEAEIIDYDTRVNEWCQREAEIHKTQPDLVGHDLEVAIGNFPWPPPMGWKSAWRPCGIYYTMLKRIVPFAFKGVLYYQGEEDAPRYPLYKNLLKAMIKEYREDFLDENLPFIDMQLPMWIEEYIATENREWGGLRKAQQEAVDETENTYLTTLLDCGEVDNIHPVDKKTPGERLAANVLKWVYGSENGADTLKLDKAEAKDDTVVLTFTNTYGAVKIMDNELVDYRKENPDVDADHIYGFEVTTDGENWTVPESRIEGESVVLRSTDGKKIRGVQYGYFNYGKVNLYNAKGIPLAQLKINL